MDANGRAAVVTGGAQGIGKAITKGFLEQGMRVVMADIDEEAGRESKDELSGLGDVEYIRTDVSQENDVGEMIRLAAERFGRLDVLVNNAGIFVDTHIPVTELSLEEWNRVIGVNLTSVFLGARFAAPLLGKARGVIMNISSTRAFMSEKNTEPYSASKGGILALTHALAVSLGPEVRVNCVCPGWIATDEWEKMSKRHPPRIRAEEHAQHPAGRVGTPEDIARAVSFLCAPANDFITGAAFIIDGGMTRKMIYI